MRLNESYISQGSGSSIAAMPDVSWLTSDARSCLQKTMTAESLLDPRNSDLAMVV